MRLLMEVECIHKNERNTQSQDTTTRKKDETRHQRFTCQSCMWQREQARRGRLPHLPSSSQAQLLAALHSRRSTQHAHHHNGESTTRHHGAQYAPSM